MISTKESICSHEIIYHDCNKCLYNYESKIKGKPNIVEYNCNDNIERDLYTLSYISNINELILKNLNFSCNKTFKFEDEPITNRQYSEIAILLDYLPSLSLEFILLSKLIVSYKVDDSNLCQHKIVKRYCYCCNPVKDMLCIHNTFSKLCGICNIYYIKISVEKIRQYIFSNQIL